MLRCFAMILLLLWSSLAQSQTTSLRQQRVLAGDIAELVITYKADLPSMYAIDTAPLQADFKVLDTRSRVSRIYQADRALVTIAARNCNSSSIRSAPSNNPQQTFFSKSRPFQRIPTRASRRAS